MITQNSKCNFSKDRCNVTITEVDAHDVGTYTFKASNDVGSDTVTLELILEEGVPTVTNSTMYILVLLISVILLCISVGRSESSTNLTGIIAGTCGALLALVVFVVVFVFCFMRYKPYFILKILLQLAFSLDINILLYKTIKRILINLGRKELTVMDSCRYEVAQISSFLVRSTSIFPIMPIQQIGHFTHHD